MVDAVGKRITFRYKRPNPEIEDTLRNLLTEAKEKNSHLTPILEEALISLSSYPLPLKSGAQCAILKGFDKRLCQFLDDHLIFRKYQNENVSPCNVEVVKENSESSRKSRVSNDELQPKKRRTSLQKSKNYKPAYRSGGFAILLALSDYPSESFKKEELIEKAQKYCDESFVRPKHGTFYSSWSSMGKLIAKSLVKKTKKDNFFYYSLTEDGCKLATDLALEAKSRCNDNDIIFNNTPSQVWNDLYETVSDKNSISPQIESLAQNEDISSELCSIVLLAGSYDIILLIDKKETSGLNKKNDPTVAEFKKYPNLKHEYRNLKVGDFTWIARHNINQHQELVLPYIVERKRMDDLASSIKDGRFHEQKFRLRRCGLTNVFYMVEKYGNNKHVGLPIQNLMQALANTKELDGFKIHITESLLHSARFLAMLTARLNEEFKDIELKGWNKNAEGEYLMTFDYFNKASTKSKPLTVRDMFMKMLLQLKGISLEKAKAIANAYPTPKLLIDTYKSCDSGKGEYLLANIKCATSNRNVGPVISKSLYYLFSRGEFD